MATLAYRRHDIADRVWQLLEPRLPGREGGWGGKARDNRLFINAVFWILRTGAPWRDLPPDYGDWKNTHRRFCRWRDKGIWEALLEQLVTEADYEWLMIDASHIKVHPHAAGAKVGRVRIAHPWQGPTPMGDHTKTSHASKVILFASPEEGARCAPYLAVNKPCWCGISGHRP